LTDIQNRSFTGSWGFNPNPVETIVYSLNLANRSPGDVVLEFEGESVTGYCWTAVTEEGKGRIEMMGTDPQYRGKGVAKRLMLCGLYHLKDRGVGVTVLTVDSKNWPASVLYSSIGFEVTAKSLWYEKVID
ncbi:MAG: GNAT family N-acetyltransferase, partial [Dehalococcoidales bacterium]